MNKRVDLIVPKRIPNSKIPRYAIMRVYGKHPTMTWPTDVRMTVDELHHLAARLLVAATQLEDE